jgi:hypothetical protein
MVGKYAWPSLSIVQDEWIDRKKYRIRGAMIFVVSQSNFYTSLLQESEGVCQARRMQVIRRI